jgi:cytochrome b subunit of formate dehydrogenase
VATFMDSYQFYKSLYDRELNRRKDLDSAVNLPITILTILVAANSYLIGKETGIHQKCLIIFSNIILALLLVSFLISIFYLIRSYNNLFKGFGYRNLGLTKEIRNFEVNEIQKYNAQVDEKEKLNFETIIIEKLAHYTDDHIVFNDKRSLDLHRAKTFIIVTLVLTGIKFLLLAFKYLTP